MVLTIEEKRARKKIRDKKYYEKNKEKIKKQVQQYREDNKERKKIADKKYRENNREQFINSSKKYRENNREIINEKSKIFSKKYNKTPNGIKARTINNWKQSGLQDEDISALYEQYLIAINCDECNVEFGVFGDGTGTFKCMDHDHETNLFRNFLCNNCNVKRG